MSKSNWSVWVSVLSKSATCAATSFMLISPWSCEDEQNSPLAYGYNAISYISITDDVMPRLFYTGRTWTRETKLTRCQDVNLWYWQMLKCALLRMSVIKRADIDNEWDQRMIQTCAFMYKTHWEVSSLLFKNLYSVRWLLLPQHDLVYRICSQWNWKVIHLSYSISRVK